MPYEIITEKEVLGWFDTVVRDEFIRLFYHHAHSGALTVEEREGGYLYARCILGETAKAFCPFSDIGRDMEKRISQT